MKPIFKAAFLAIVLSFALSSKAQSKLNTTPEKETGFWVIENNKHSPKNSTVYFYNEDKELVYKESIIGKRININRKKTCKQLNAVLEQCLLSWKKEKTIKENQQWLAAKL
jgi:hypothetical protein